MPPSPPTSSPPTTASLKAWWRQFTILQKLQQKRANDSSQGAVFGVPLRDSLRYASVQISTANQNGELYVWGYIPVVVAKCGLFLKEKGTEVEGIFRINGSAKRMRELQTIFETPPRYGKNIQWQEHAFTPHDVASIFRRFLTFMPEPIIPHSLYHDFRAAYSRAPFVIEEVIASYKRLIGKLPLANQYLLLYVLDLLTVFAKKADINKMNAANLAVVFRPAILNHPSQEMSPEHHKLSQEVVEFLIEHQDWFMLDIPPPPRKDSILDSNKPKPGRNGSNFSTTSPTSPTVLPSKVGILGKKDKSSKGETGSPSKNSKGPFSSLTNQSRPTEEPEDFNLYVGPLSDEEEAAEGGWRLAGAAAGGSSVGRRRTFSERGSPRPPMVDEQNSGRKSAENVGTAGMSMSAPAGGAGAILTGNPIHLTPVRETSGVDMDVLAELQEKENNAAVPAVTVTSSHQRSGTGSRSGTAGSAVEAGGTSTGTASVLGTGANVSRSSSTKDRRTKFDDSKHPRTEDEREKRGRSIISGVFGGRRSRTVEGTPATGTATTTTTTTGGADVSRAGSRGGHDRHVLKKRNSRGDVEKI